MKNNVDQNPEAASRFNVRSIPTLILFKNGKPVETVIGAVSQNALLQQLAPHLG